eukprot:GFUD01004627.1.p1 GENE.GFUD01004627.1~~GFUD01004627.1.p1  ORF type:complete len:1179 (+),score=495.15 GFUD01004627.1:105-3641(+)
MFVKSMVIDGFKSYGQRTEINGWDNKFNAITGLNGSGKSNILDAICFLLGITNLTHVRAANLQELVYKNGQAGVTKATVSITFDNRDKKQSPLGYEHYDEVTITRQVVIGGKNKYLINGSNVQNNRVQDFFRSVQLNVNNPHFLIMQGRITKVLNMKPPEILAMIEEAAGTRMYEAKKQQAEKTIEKKDAKLKEINDILAEEINPTLTKLKEERSAYLEFQKIQRELEHLTKLYLAWKFCCAEETAGKTKEELETLKTKLEEIQELIRQGEEEMAEIDVAIRELERARDNEIGDQVMEKEGVLREKEKQEAKFNSALKTLKDSLKQEDKKKKQIEKGLGDDRKTLGSKEMVMAGMQDMFDKLRQDDEKCRADLEAAQNRYQAISLGEVMVEGGGSATLQEQIINTKKEISSAETEIKAADTKVKHNTEQFKKKQIEMKKTEAEYKRDSGALGKYEKEVADLENRLGKVQYEEGMVERLEGEQRTLRQEVNQLRGAVEGTLARNHGLDFQYKDPERGFDRRQVKGVAAKLFRVKDERFFTGLETAAGGKLYNVVIDTDVVGKQLLKHGQLARRTTFIPLNKVASNRLDARTLEAARKVGGRDNVWAAIDLVEFSTEVEPAMCHLFGQALICKDLDTANKVAFDRNVQRVCFTLEGDKVSPGGDMSGGAAQRGGSMLQQLASIMQQEQELGEKQQQLEQIGQKIRQISGVANQYNTLSQQLELKQTELGLIRGRLQQTVHHQLAEEVKELEAATQAVKDGVEQARETVKEGAKKLKDLEYKVKNAKELREKELKAADEHVKKSKKAAEESKGKWSAKEQEEGSLKLELEELRNSITGAEEQLVAVAKAIELWEQQIIEQQDEVKKATEDVKQAKQEVKQQKDVLAAQNKEIGSKQDRKKQIEKTAADKELETQTLNHAVTKAVGEAKEADRKVADMLEQHEWIQDDRKFFGQQNTAYDFKATDPGEAGRRIQKLEGTKEKLAKSVNMRAMNMLGKAEEQYNDLIKKKKIVENDKAKINAVIAELDQKKKVALRQAWDQVNKDFGSIFSSLLPGTHAKLEPPEGQDVLDGLEVKVAFGNVWKESLNELSGGQRSLVALSLILSLLLFKPAPLYILDEVDAALDLSHTQNIGHMLKTHFKHSQFIVVSLKDGMFNNANVLYRTKFIDGMSTVSRTTQNQNKK